MSQLNLLPATRNGSWEYDGISRREARHAHAEFLQAQSALRELLALKKKRRAEGLSEPVSLDEALLRRNFRTFATVIFACVAIESFVNFYGVRRFGNAFNQSRSENLPLRKKIRRILAHTTSVTVDDGDLLFKALARLVARRNRLAHPKTYEFEENVEPPEMETWTTAANESIEDMDAFFNRFGELDAEARGVIASF